MIAIRQPGDALKPRAITALGASMVAMPLVFVAIFLLHPPTVQAVQPDSASYLNFEAARSGGYPIFLAALKRIADDIRLYTTAQLMLYAASVAALGWQALRLSGSALLALAVQALLLWNPLVDRYHFAILTESVFFSASALFLAGTFAYLRRPSVVPLSLVAIMAGYLTAVRPTGLVFIPVAVLLVFLVPNNKRRLLVHAAVVLALSLGVLLLESMYYHSRHPGPRQTLAPLHVFAKSGLVDVKDVDAMIRDAPPEERTLQRALATDLAPLRRFLSAAPPGAARCRLMANYETYVQYRFAIPERTALINARGEAAIMHIGLARIAHTPVGYLRHVAENLYCLWSFGLMTNAELRALRSYIAQNPPPLHVDAEMVEALTAQPAIMPPVLVRWMLFALAAVFGVAMVAVAWRAVRRRPPDHWMAVTGLCGALVHGSLLLTAFAGVAISRYPLGLWVPFSVGALACLLCARPVVGRGPTG